MPKKNTLRIDKSKYLEHQDSKISPNNQFNTFASFSYPFTNVPIAMRLPSLMRDCHLRTENMNMDL